MDLKRAVSREPDNFVHWLLLSRIETERGNLDASVESQLGEIERGLADTLRRQT